jgi:hypothetical protein
MCMFQDHEIFIKTINHLKVICKRFQIVSQTPIYVSLIIPGIQNAS